MVKLFGDVAREGFPRADRGVSSKVRLFGYVRTSLRNPDGSAQIEALERIGADPIFLDAARSLGEQMFGFDKIFAAASKGDKVAVVSLYQLGTSLKDVLSVINSLHQRDIHLVSIDDGIDTSLASSDNMFNVFAAVSSYVHRVRSERIKNGIAIAHSKGVRSGRVLDMTKVHSAMELIKAGVPPREAAAQVGLGSSTVYREMRRLGIERPV